MDRRRGRKFPTILRHGNAARVYKAQAPDYRRFEGLEVRRSGKTFRTGRAGPLRNDFGMTSSKATQEKPPLDGYQIPEGVYDEVFSRADEPRAPWRNFLDAVGQFDAEDLDLRTLRAERMLQENGVTFNVFGDPTAAPRPWRIDILPTVVSNEEWSKLEVAIDQRVKLLDYLVRDIHGPQELLKSGLLPPEVIFGHPGFLRPLHGLLHARSREETMGLSVSSASRAITLYASELARSPSGDWFVMADRAEAPVGLGFALENRIVISRSVSHWLHELTVQRLAPFFVRLQNTLKNAARGKSESPRIVLLSGGPSQPYYFEDVYLARYLGFTLVEGSDLAVRDERVYIKTLAGLLPVDVIFSRGDERGIDPLELGGESPHGVPGVLQAARQGNVVIANVPGCGVIESPVFMAFLPTLCERFFGEPLKLPSIATWWCGDQTARKYVFEHLEDLVIKPAFEASGGEEIFGDRLSAGERTVLKAKIEAAPFAFVGQERIARSAAPVWHDRKVHCGHVAWRAFAVAEGNDFHLMPGALLRVNPTPEPMELSIAAGEGSKDLWVLSDSPVEPVTLLATDERPVSLRRTSALFPSRVADDLYWLGFSLDRTDYLARLLRSVGERLAAESHQLARDTQVLIRALADQGQIEPGFAVPDLDEQLPYLEMSLPHTVFDVREIRGISFAVSEMLRLASRVRDWISPDTWRTINHAATSFLSLGKKGRADLATVLSGTDELIAEVASISGLFHDGMIRGPAWRFLDLGRRMERCRDILGLLRSTIATKQLNERSVLRALIEVLDCRMTYRSRYLDNVQQGAVLDLFVTDDSNPRSVVFQLATIDDHVRVLPRETSMPLLSDEDRLSAAALHHTRMITATQLSESPPRDVDRALTHVEQIIRHLADALTRKFLLHSGTPRQIHDDQGM